MLRLGQVVLWDWAAGGVRVEGFRRVGWGKLTSAALVTVFQFGLEPLFFPGVGVGSVVGHPEDFGRGPHQEFDAGEVGGIVPLDAPTCLAAGKGLFEAGLLILDLLFFPCDEVGIALGDGVTPMLIPNFIFTKFTF